MRSSRAAAENERRRAKAANARRRASRSITRHYINAASYVFQAFPASDVVSGQAGNATCAITRTMEAHMRTHRESHQHTLIAVLITVVTSFALGACSSTASTVAQAKPVINPSWSSLA